MGSRIFLAAVEPSTLTIESVGDAVRQRWPEVDQYRRDHNGERRLGFMAPVDSSLVDCVFFEGQQFVTADLSEPGAAFLEWFQRLAPETVPWVVFTEQWTDPVPVPARATAQQLLNAAHWPDTGSQPDPATPQRPAPV